MSNLHDAPDFGPDFRPDFRPDWSPDLGPDWGPDEDFWPQPSHSLTLTPADMAWAVGVSQPIADETQQWQGFLRAIALRGWQRWLEQGALDLVADYPPDQVPAAGVTCRVGGFRLCLLSQGSLSDEVVAIPQAALDDPRDCAHLYVLIEVQEEADQVTILGGLRHDQLRAYRQRQRLEPQADGTYLLPVQLFDAPPERLLLYLSCLNPAMVVTPAAVPAEAPPALPRLIHLGQGGLINAGRWLQNQLDAVADSLAWSLMPPLTPTYASAMRSPTEELDAVLAELAPTVAIPTTARGAFTDLQRLGLPYRLYALTWTLFEAGAPEWSLFLMLGPVPGEQLPPGIRLVVADAAAVLADEILSPQSDATHLYAQVIGRWDEQFTASIHLPNGTVVNWPPFEFRPD